MIFTRPPEIHNAGSMRGTYVEGSFHGVSDADQATFQEVFEGFHNLVVQGEKLTGAQWIVAISKSVGERALQRASTQGFLGVVRKVMMVDKFSDDYLLFNPDGTPLHRGTKGVCVDVQYGLADLETDDLSQWKLVMVKDIEPKAMDQTRLHMARNHASDHGLGKLEDFRYKPKADEWAFAHHFYDVDVGYKVFTRLTPPDTSPATDRRAGVRALHLLQSGTPAGAADIDATLYLLRELTAHFGYNTFAVRVKSHVIEHTFGQFGVEITTDEAMREVLLGFVRKTQNLEAITTGPVHLCRPAALINSEGSCEPFEVQAYPSLIGWQVPQDFLQRFLTQESMLP